MGLGFSAGSSGGAVGAAAAASAADGIDVVQGYAHMRYLDQDWYLVRRAAGSSDTDGEACWHPANDQLAGTERYGTNDANPLGDQTFSVPFQNFAYDKLMMASGDMSMYVVLDKDVMDECTSGAVDGQWHPVISQSSASDSQTTVLQYCRSGATEDPWISVGEHPDRIVYGEGKIVILSRIACCPSR